MSAPVTPLEARRQRRPRRTALLAAAVVLPLLVAGAAGAMLLTPSPLRPRLARASTFHDPRAGFSLKYPRDWRLERARPSQGVRFLVDAPGAPAAQLSTVTVVTGAARGPLPSAPDLARTVIAGLRPELPGIRLTSTTTTTLRGGPAVELQLSDPSTVPAASVEEVAGRTSDDRPLTVTVTVHDPRYAPRDVELRDFLASIVS
jgi:hypothetical protein